MSAMMGTKKSCRSLAIAAAMLIGLTASLALADGDAATDGVALATEYCSACHRVKAEQPQPPAVIIDESTSQEAIPAPSFREIAQRPGRDADYLRALIQAPHFPMPEQQYIPEELDAIIAYITSLKDSPGSW